MKRLVLLLPFVAFNAVAEIRSVHCPLGCPSLDIPGNDVVFGHVYALSQSPKTLFADWVAYEVDVLNFGAGPGRNWANNPLIDEAQTLEPKDYSGAHKALKVDRGHQAPLASFAGSRYWPELNYLSNITPQKAALNQGPWMHLEQAVRDGVSFRNSLYVITGPLYEGDTVELPKADEDHIIPSGYYKIVYDERGNAAAFIMPQSSPRNTKYCNTKTTVAKIKAKVSYSLPKLTNSNKILKRLGC